MLMYLHTYNIRFSTIGNIINPIRNAIRLIQVSWLPSFAETSPMLSRIAY